MKVGTGNQADCLDNISGYACPPGPSRTDRGDEDPVQPSSDKPTFLIPQVPIQGASPLGIEGSPSLAGFGAAAPSSCNSSENQQVFAWYPDIQPFDICQAGKLTPGYGDAHAKCGEVRFKILCPQNPKHHARFANYNCHRAACPTCWPGWAGRAADDTVSRVEGYRDAHRSQYLPRHVSIHPPQGLIVPGDDALQQLYDEGRKIAAVLGLTAAAAIPHPYRLNKDTRDAVEAAAAGNNLNRYEWALSQPNWPDLVHFSPHLHLIAYGPLMDADAFHKMTGWTYRNHDGDGDVGRSGTDLRRTVYYLLTHAWVLGNHRIVRYWLGMSTHRLACIDAGYAVKTEPCPVCACDMVKTPPDVTWDDGTVHHFYQDLHTAPIHTTKVRLYIYEVRVKGRPKRARSCSQAALAIWGPAGPPVLS